jgi:hemolysin type calcium-binding protein
MFTGAILATCVTGSAGSRSLGVVHRLVLPVAVAASFVLVVSAVPAASGLSPTPIPGPTATPDGPASLAAQPCTIEGTESSDTLVGTPGPDVICGHGGDDVLQGLDGDDVLDGGDGADTASFDLSACCIRGDLAAGTATGAGTDQLVAIESLTGSAGDDVLRGEAGPNALSGLGGVDLLYGGEGDDVLIGGDDEDWLAGEGGTNAMDGGPGADICAEGGGTSCSPPSPPDGNDTHGIMDVRLVDTGGGTAVWRVGTFSRSSKKQLWDAGYVVVSLDTKEGPGVDFELVGRSTGRRMLGLLLRPDQRRPVGRVEARRPGGRSLRLAVALDRLEVPPERAYIRWSVRTLLTGDRCRPCIDVIPAEGEGAFPQPV